MTWELGNSSCFSAKTLSIMHCDNSDDRHARRWRKPLRNVIEYATCRKWKNLDLVLWEMTSDNEVLRGPPAQGEPQFIWSWVLLMRTGYLLISITFCVIHSCSNEYFDCDSTFYTYRNVQLQPITQYIIQFFINWFQIGVVHHKNEECSNENRMCHYLRRVLEIVDFIVLSAQIDHMLPVVNSHCVAKTTTPYINYIAGKTSFFFL